jgi:hypothetical protein
MHITVELSPEEAQALQDAKKRLCTRSASQVVRYAIFYFLHHAKKETKEKQK